MAQDSPNAMKGRRNELIFKELIFTDKFMDKMGKRNRLSCLNVSTRIH